MPELIDEKTRAELKNVLASLKESASSVPGLYAAGDVTDAFQKQIIIAAGEEAKASFSAYAYLVENGRVSRKAVRDSWQQ